MSRNSHTADPKSPPFLLRETEFRDTSGWHDAAVGRVLSAGPLATGGVAIEFLTSPRQLDSKSLRGPAVRVSLSREDAGELMRALERALFGRQ